MSQQPITSPDIRLISAEELSFFLKENGESAFRQKQISEWLWKKGAINFDEMTNLSLILREKLKSSFTFKAAAISQERQSNDGTAKFVFTLHDGHKIEGVLIPSNDRVTTCVSSQVGCALACGFCATGTMGFTRNLHATEIWDQFILMNRRSVELYGKEVTNIVYMGMGEPLLNYDNVLESIRLLTTDTGKGLSPSRITLSTVGITQGIRQLADDGFKAGLAVSLHTADEQVRKEIMPVTKTNSLDELRQALQYFVGKTGSRITFEYVMLSGINDSLRDAEKLAQYCKSFPVKINIIEYNRTDSDFRGSIPQAKETFVRFLENRNLIVNIRKSKGEDIDAACGQLVEKSRKSR
ncbi:23S rRNA (adenine(2503)-C(2))-methyltransferase RlmN [Bacteroidales bacterium OttesenSCG-928-B11]|nr:23S rRNA (adenine(2503)-C(2))-methyltransferase RlmN [Bacteroidales bacterium OttesenSCG-928-B11]MDL2326349.1 23S rRNA (adenine(2503)-C(2))-methyltransferase RlmN [Bacteroidales bacterium OttesenSCG-928-A14]